MRIEKNEGTADRVVRSIVTIGLFIAAGLTDGNARIVFLIFGTTMTITTIMGWCPLYPLLGVNTCGGGKKKKAE